MSISSMFKEIEISPTSKFKLKSCKAKTPHINYTWRGLYLPPCPTGIMRLDENLSHPGREKNSHRGPWDQHKDPSVVGPAVPKVWMSVKIFWIFCNGSILCNLKLENMCIIERSLFSMLMNGMHLTTVPHELPWHMAGALVNVRWP